MSFDDRRTVGIICDKETATSFFIGGLSIENKNGEPNMLMVDEYTTNTMLSEFYERLNARRDVAIILISFELTRRIKGFTTENIDKFPYVLRIPTKTTLEHNIHPNDFLKPLFPHTKEYYE